VFEGIRAYDTTGGAAVFCLDQHVERLFSSARICRMELPCSTAEIKQAIIDTVKANGLKACYIRPIAFRGFSSLSLDPRTCPVEVAIIAYEWGRYLGWESVEQGVDVGVSSWRRMAPDTFPAVAKLGGQYLNSQFIAMEAAQHGYTEGIALDINGFVSEGSGENVFLVSRGRIFTPALDSSILQGITRRCVFTLSDELGYPIREERIPRELLYMADEVFFSGTAAEITPVRAVDGITIGTGRRGPVTEQLQVQFFGITSGELPDRHGWLTQVS
jgi:branched-chain amino acid aminotransferase